MFSCLLLVLGGLFVPGLAVLRIRDSRRGTFCSRQDHVLRNHVIGERDVTDRISCTMECVAEPTCRSVNFKKGMSNNGDGAKCELNDATKYYAKKENYEKNTTYDHVFDSDDIPLSCSQIKVSVLSSTTGYYWVKDVTDEYVTRLVYCDMEKYDGGWTLVTSISNTNNNHLQKNKVNCLNNSLCVEYNTTNIQTRKMTDDDIHTMANVKGVFRVDVLKTPPYSVFFKIPSGAQHFDSSCDGNSCPRIITSHYYPYQWESNCKGTSLGYKFGHSGVGIHCYHVFDNESPEDCSSGWQSSKYPDERALYGFTCWGNSGIFSNFRGLLYVK